MAKDFMDIGPSPKSFMDIGPADKEQPKRPQVLQSDFPEVTQVPTKVPLKALGQMYLGSPSSDIAKTLAEKGYEVRGTPGDEQVNINGQWYNVNSPGFSGQDIMQLPAQAIMSIPGARAASMAGRAVGAGMRGLAARLGAQGATDVAQNVGEQSLKSAVAGEDRPIDVGEAAVVGGIGAAGELAETGVRKFMRGRMAKSAGAESGGLVEQATGGMISPEQLRYAQRMEAAGRPLIAFQANPIVEGRQKALMNNTAARDKIVRALAGNSDNSVKYLADAIDQFAPATPIRGGGTIDDAIASMRTGSPEIQAQARKYVDSQRQAMRDQANTDFEAIKAAAVPVDLSPVLDKIQAMKDSVKSDTPTWRGLDKVQQLLTTKKMVQVVDAQGLPILGKKVEVDTPVWDPQKDIFSTKYAIQDVISGKVDKDAIIDRDTARRLRSVVEGMDDIIDSKYLAAGGPTLKEAKDRYRRSLQDLNKLDDTVIGKMAGASTEDDIYALIKAEKAFFEDPTMTPQAAKNMAAFFRRTPEGEDAMAKLIQNRLTAVRGEIKGLPSVEEIVDPTRRRDVNIVDNAPGKALRGMFELPEREKEILYSVMTPEQKSNMSSLEKYLQLSSLGRSPGSDTVQKLAASGELQASESILRGRSIGAATMDYMSSKFNKMRSDKALSAMAEAVSNPQWATELTKYRAFMLSYDRTFDEKYLKKAADILSGVLARSAAQPD